MKHFMLGFGLGATVVATAFVLAIKDSPGFKSRTDEIWERLAWIDPYEDE